jgi:transcription antitermination factor NusG
VVDTIVRLDPLAAPAGLSKKKFVVQQIVNGIAHLSSFGSDEKLNVPVDKLRTVIPAVGSKVKVLHGSLAGANGIVKRIDVVAQLVGVFIDDTLTTAGDSLLYFSFQQVSKTI